MSGTIPSLILYPLYPGGPQVRANSGTLNAGSAGKTGANNFVPVYGVNVPRDLSSLEAESYFTRNGYSAISNRSVSAAGINRNNLGFDPTVLGGMKRVSAPTAPNIYKDLEKLMATSELRLADLLTQPEFRLSSIGLELKVTTDGMGGIDTVTRSPSSLGATPWVDFTADTFGGLNSAVITTGATFKLTDLSIDTGMPVPSPQGTVRPSNNNLSNPAGNLPGSAINPPRTAGIFNLENLEKQALLALQNQSLDLDRLTPELERLYQLQAAENTTGNDFKLGRGALESQQLAATQAGLGVKTSEAFQANVVGLMNASKQSESYASVFAPRMDQVMNGRIAGSPWVQGQAASAFGGGSGNSSGFEMGAAVADAMSRKGKNSYMPFQMQSGPQEQGSGNANPFLGAGAGTGSGSGAGSSQFGGQANQHFRPRKPLAFSA
ncbi:hypothetical protein [Vampirovibrio sp.]|uniref:hypothetical protein n=1 Tax=Vampirovibrio sp. TaxID=2717857 RepID=UPI00359428A0